MITVTEKAKSKLIELRTSEGKTEAHNIRVSVKGGGCSGLMYDLGFDAELKPADQVFEDKGIKILVDKQDSPILNGTVIDYKQSLMGGGFTIENPNAIASCGCGSSFKTAKNAGTPENC